MTLIVDVAANAPPTVANSVRVSGNELNTGNNTASDITVIDQPDLTITKTHFADFILGQVGAVYTIAVRNIGSGATTGIVTVVDTLPAGVSTHEEKREEGRVLYRFEAKAVPRVVPEPGMPGWGEVASFAVLLRMRPYILDSERDYPWVSAALGLDCYPLIYRSALRDFEGTMLFVSHDRTFLKGLSNRVLELRPGDPEAGLPRRSPFPYLGSYVEYVERTGHEAAGVHG